jgi:kinesin light chain
VQSSAAPTLDALASEELMLARSRLGALESAVGYDHPRVAAELHLIGAIHHDAHRHAEAIAFYGAALGIRERTLGADHPEVAATLEDMSVARSEAGEDAEAARLLTRAERIRRARHVADEAVLEAAT